MPTASRCSMILCSMILAASCMLAAPSQAQTVPPAGKQFQINTYTTNSQRSSALAVEPDGDFVVAWQSSASAFDDTSG